MNCKSTSQVNSFTLYYEYAAVRPFDADLNTRWKIHEDGKVYMVKNSSAGTIPSPGITFYSDTTFPATPVTSLSTQQMAKIGKSIEDNNFFNGTEYEIDPQVEDGAVIRITISWKGKIKTVTMVNKPLQNIEKIVLDINTELPDNAKFLTYPIWN